MENFPKMFFPKIVSNFFQTSIIKIDGKFVVNTFMTDFYFEYWMCTPCGLLNTIKGE